MNKQISNVSYEKLKQDYKMYDDMNKSLQQDLEKAIVDRDPTREMQIAREGSAVEKKMKEIEAEMKIVEADAANIASLKAELEQLKAEAEENMKAYQANLKKSSNNQDELRAINEEEMSLVYYGSTLEKTIKKLEERISRAAGAIESSANENQPSL